MDNKAKIMELVENGYDKVEMIRSLVNWLGETESGDFLEKYLGISDDEEDDECNFG